MRRRNPNSRFAQGMRQDMARNKARYKADAQEAEQAEDFDLAYWACCDEHETTFLIGESCPKCCEEETK